MTEDLVSAISNANIKDSVKKKISRERIGKEFTLMLKGKNPLKAIFLLESFKYFEVIFDLPQLEISQDWLKHMQENFSFEQYTAVLLMSIRNEKYGKNEMLAKKVCKSALKLPNKSTDTICLYLKNIDKVLGLCKNFDAVSAGQVIISLGSQWESLISLLPSSSFSNLKQKIYSESLQDFWKEPPLLSVIPN